MGVASISCSCHEGGFRVDVCGCSFGVAPMDEDRKYVEETRNDQGLHECEIFGKWSLELEEDYAWKNCKKTLNDHKNFIPFLEFSQQHLAEQYRHSQFLLEYIEVLASLTVRLRVHCVSENRPDGYPLACARGTDLRHLGTGWVYKVSQGQGRCPCGCFEYWWGIQIFTACHVVFDKKEAQKTEVDLFYDSESSNVTILYGHDVEDNSMSEDVCILHCYSHDKNLFESLEGIVNRYEVLKWDVPASLMSTLCVVISHPHGAPKKVTVGEMLGTAQCDPEKSLMSDFMFTYSADTCKGSSGAPVLAAISRKKLGASGVWPGAGPHSFRLTDELRQCGSGSFYMNAG
ncbi:hypothetical protein EGW08_007052 [Elysia chlorotica]|uniref:Peptidase S1 domain-containing protein n=1 Tax=Elysia chlorotica TaxID=188477 RepID=A0A433TUI0_ELYCH|nr:hypothetical protein EGW08_007052 [Elysia chlorotica]